MQPLSYRATFPTSLFLLYMYLSPFLSHVEKWYYIEINCFFFYILEEMLGAAWITLRNLISPLETPLDNGHSLNRPMPCNFMETIIKYHQSTHFLTIGIRRERWVNHFILRHNYWYIRNSHYLNLNITYKTFNGHSSIVFLILKFPNFLTSNVNLDKNRPSRLLHHLYSLQFLRLA